MLEDLLKMKRFWLGLPWLGLPGCVQRVCSAPKSCRAVQQMPPPAAASVLLGGSKRCCSPSPQRSGNGVAQVLAVLVALAVVAAMTHPSTRRRVPGLADEDDAAVKVAPNQIHPVVARTQRVSELEPVGLPLNTER